MVAGLDLHLRLTSKHIVAMKKSRIAFPETVRPNEPSAKFVNLLNKADLPEVASLDCSRNRLQLCKSALVLFTGAFARRLALLYVSFGLRDAAYECQVSGAQLFRLRISRFGVRRIQKGRNEVAGQVPTRRAARPRELITIFCLFSFLSPFCRLILRMARRMSKQQQVLCFCRQASCTASIPSSDVR